MLLPLLALLLLFSRTARAESGAVLSLTQLNRPGMTIGVSQGSAAENTVRAELPQARIAYFTDTPSAYLAVAQGRIDAFVFDLNQMRLAIADGAAGVRLLDETLGEPVRVAVGISPVSEIPSLEGSLNRFISSLRSDGTLDDMFRRWVLQGSQAMPDIPQAAQPSLKLMVGTTGTVRPFSFYAGKELAGFDIELARRFAAFLGASLTFKVYDFGGIVAAAASGDVDCIMSNLNITPERLEAMPFSDVLYEEKLLQGVRLRDRGPYRGHSGHHSGDCHGHV